MTTWHEDEHLEDVVWFAKTAAHHPAVEIDEVLFLHVGEKDRKDEIATLYDAA